jgi:hypothetical protein
MTPKRMALTGEKRGGACQKALTDLLKLPTTGLRLLDAWLGKAPLRTGLDDAPGKSEQLHAIDYRAGGRDDVRGSFFSGVV